MANYLNKFEVPQKNKRERNCHFISTTTKNNIHLCVFVKEKNKQPNGLQIGVLRKKGKKKEQPESVHTL